MPSILKRDFAPVSGQAWQEIDEVAADAVKRNISARKIVDFSGPHGWELAAVNLGRLDLQKQPTKEGVAWGARKVLPLIETRTAFKLNQLELDNISRGSVDADLDPLEDVVTKAARFEDTVIYNGFKKGEMIGMIEASEHRAIKLPADAGEYPAAISRAAETLELSGVEGPYALVLGPDQYHGLLHASHHGYPASRIVSDIIKGQILMSPVLKGGVLASTRGGDFELTVGKDFSIGYANHDRETVELFVTESFAFRVLEPKAAIGFTV